MRSDVDPEAVRETFEGHWERGGPGHPRLVHRSPHRRGRSREGRRLRPREDPEALSRTRETAEKLCPRGYPFGSKRLVLEIEYYDTFNRDNVTLVDVKADPIRPDHADGVRTTDAEYHARRPGAGDGVRRPHRRAVRDGHQGRRRADVARGLGRRAADLSRASPPTDSPTCSSSQEPELPRCSATSSSRSSSTSSGSPTTSSTCTRTDCTGVRPGSRSSAPGSPRSTRSPSHTLFFKGNSWYVGANIPGKPRVFSLYLGGVGRYRDICEDVAADDYRGFETT